MRNSTKMRSMSKEKDSGLSRRAFMTLGAAGVALAAGTVPTGSAGAGTVPGRGMGTGPRNAGTGTVRRGSVPARNRRPYEGLDWSKVVRVKTTSHGHCPNQWWIDQYLKRGLEFLTLSNYYPSAPWCPLSKMTENYWRVRQKHSVMVNGKRVRGPFDWNKIIEPWKDEISEKELAKFPSWAAKYPFVEGDKMFKPLPKGVLEAPNAEHHKFLMKDGSPAKDLHLCAPGSAFASGTFDAHNLFKTGSHGYDPGSGEYWGTAIDRMLAGLVYPDGGGVTINHPSWTKLDRHFMLELLDHDPRVLGIEVIEGKGVNSENYWDWALSTGRQCFGFFVPDWWVDKKVFGANILCVHEKTVRACLKAYREGCFYGAKNALDELAFTRIAFDGKTVSAATDKPARFEVITARGVVKRAEGTDVSWTVEKEDYWQGPGYHIYARVKAYGLDSDEELFSQPFMLKD